MKLCSDIVHIIDTGWEVSTWLRALCRISSEARVLLRLHIIIRHCLGGFYVTEGLCVESHPQLHLNNVSFTYSTTVDQKLNLLPLSLFSSTAISTQHQRFCANFSISLLHLVSCSVRARLFYPIAACIFQCSSKSVSPYTLYRQP